ncbi:unnamed protein product [Cladocopium goreaui]|uniref:Uncharacterized protein n=1 Tax=Cladocopium goreaui TaxID=2562237 RepID=A0A9P1FTT4_9DINO|nr:unnamed protein product [Cladocopium goreaui]
MCLRTGPTSKLICHFCNEQDWWHLGPSGSVATWNSSGRPEHDPWKKKASLLRQVPGGEAASRIRCDLAHIWAIGVGKEFIGSALLLLAGELRVWPGRSLGARLDHAYGLFRTWCSNSKQTCKINEFRLRTFKVTSLLQYPSLKGQGHDCIVLHKWLSHVCEEIQRDDLEPGLNVRALLSLTTVFLMWFAHPKFRDSESLATGLVAVGIIYGLLPMIFHRESIDPNLLPAASAILAGFGLFQCDPLGVWTDSAWHLLLVPYVHFCALSAISLDSHAGHCAL